MKAVVGFLGMSIFLSNSCIEPFDTEFVDFEDVLVVDATLTDEMKQQEIFLTRSYEFNAAPQAESGATILVKDDRGNEISFVEAESGKYISQQPFAAQSGRKYQLSINTDNGRKYSSDMMGLPEANTIDSLYAKRITNDMGEEGIAISVDVSNPGEDNNFYRYEYEETYKVIAPRWIADELEVLDDETVVIVPRSPDEQVCYPTNFSTTIIQTDTEDFDRGNVENFEIRFIEQNNFITTHRYSILVRQFVQSVETANFLETLNAFSSAESLFSETQPGFLEGNVFPIDNEDERVVGFFNVSSVSEKRIFFSYRDFFPTERLPDYINPCLESAPIIGLLDLIRWDLIKYIEDNDGRIQPGGPYITVPQVCGDCTILGTSEVPDFWIE